jgi:hypothetical protein
MSTTVLASQAMQSNHNVKAQSSLNVLAAGTGESAGVMSWATLLVDLRVDRRSAMVKVITER